MPVPVYFADMRSSSQNSSTIVKIRRLLEAAGLAGIVAKDDLTAIKVHFGELGNDAFVSPVFARAAADAIREAGGKPFFSDTNTLYTGSRSNAVDHLETAVLHGFEKAVSGAPAIIADGLMGKDYREVRIGKKWFENAKIASAFLDADAMVVVSHFKGHMMAGFGGAIKNLAMGCAPAAGKREQHSCRFFVKSDRCTACGACVKVCPAGAIALKPIVETERDRGGSGEAGAAPSTALKAAFIDKSLCIGCGECAARCPVKTISMDWSVEIVEFTEKMTEYAYAASVGKKGKILHLLFVRSVVPDCDCSPWADAPLVADIGVLASTDPVAIDKAAFDLVTAAPAAAGSEAEGKAGPGDDKFTAVHPETRGLVQVEYGEAIGLGSRDYELVRI